MYPHLFVILSGLILAADTRATAEKSQSEKSRVVISLNGSWQFRRDDRSADEWKTVPVPSCFADHEVPDFHGVGWYKKTVARFTPAPGKRVLAHFEAAATSAQVWWNGRSVGRHLGGWTPFRCDITELVHKSDQDHELRVRVDEKVGHNTQGFLPIIEPHFGGLWQSVQLVIVPDPYIDDLNLLVVGDPDAAKLKIEFPIHGNTSGISRLVVRYRERSSSKWNSCIFEPQANTARTQLQQIQDGIARLEVPVPSPRRWSPDSPSLYDVEIDLVSSGSGGANQTDTVATRAAFRKIETKGDRIFLNCSPLNIRGILNWGYYPPLRTPYPPEETIRRDFETFRGFGFNLMKFCLWVPPRRYFEIADELGVLTWMEYPTWHPELTAARLPELLPEFKEFFAHDRNHPSTILRSLTCETGPGAELPVVRRLYDLAHKMVPGSLVEDDSSWIAWNRVHDFFDDHPYGNNHTWVGVLHRLNDHIRTHGVQPLVLGEAIAADTWADSDAVVARVRGRRPFWVPGFLDANLQWSERVRRIGGARSVEQLQTDSLDYAMLMRKFQIETFRREVPGGGYVVSVIRDFPLAGMGLLDYLGRPKWSAQDWSWQRETMCVLATRADQRAFGERVAGKILISHFGPTQLENVRLDISLEEAGSRRILGNVSRKLPDQPHGSLSPGTHFEFRLPMVDRPLALRLRARMHSPCTDAENSWPIWTVPDHVSGLPDVWFHSSVSDEYARTLSLTGRRLQGRPTAGVVVARHFDRELLGSWKQVGAC